MVVDSRLWQVPWNQDGQWHLCTYAALPGGSAAASIFSDGDFVEVDNVPGRREHASAWRAYRRFSAATGLDPIGAFRQAAVLN